MTTRLTILLIVLIFGLSSCLKDDLKKKHNDEISKIDNYVDQLRNEYGAENVKEFTITGYEDKVYYVVLSSSSVSGTSPQAGYYMIIKHVQSYLDGGVYATNVQSYAGDWDNYQTYKDSWDHYLFKPLKMPTSTSSIGLNAGLTRIHKGDSALFVVPSQLAYADADFTTIVYNIKLDDVIPDITEYDSLQVDYFWQLYDLDSLNTGIYYKAVGTVPSDPSSIIQDSDSIYVNFSSYYLQEEKLELFDSTETNVLIPRSQLTSYTVEGLLPFTKGFSSALDTMRIGSEALVMVPYVNGFGANGYRHDEYDYIIIPAYTSLFYKIRVVSRK